MSAPISLEEASSEPFTSSSIAQIQDSKGAINSTISAEGSSSASSKLRQLRLNFQQLEAKSNTVARNMLKAPPAAVSVNTTGIDTPLRDETQVTNRVLVPVADPIREGVAKLETSPVVLRDDNTNDNNNSSSGPDPIFQFQLADPNSFSLQDNSEEWSEARSRHSKKKEKRATKAAQDGQSQSATASSARGNTATFTTTTNNTQSPQRIKTKTTTSSQPGSPGSGISSLLGRGVRASRSQGQGRGHSKPAKMSPMRIAGSNKATGGANVGGQDNTAAGATVLVPEGHLGSKSGTRGMQGSRNNDRTASMRMADRNGGRMSRGGRGGRGGRHPAWHERSDSSLSSASHSRKSKHNIDSLSAVPDFRTGPLAITDTTEGAKITTVDESPLGSPPRVQETKKTKTQHVPDGASVQSLSSSQALTLEAPEFLELPETMNIDNPKKRPTPDAKSTPQLQGMPEHTLEQLATTGLGLDPPAASATATEFLEVPDSPASIRRAPTTSMVGEEDDLANLSEQVPLPPETVTPSNFSSPGPTDETTTTDSTIHTPVAAVPSLAELIAQHTRRIDFSFLSLESDDPISDSIDQALAPFLEKCVGLDPNFRILPWFSEEAFGTNPLEALAVPDDIPKLLTSLKKYFFNYRERYEGGEQHVSVWIKTTLPFAHFRENLGSWLKHKKMGMYDRILQVEQTSTVGWLLYSSQQINREVLQSELSMDLKMDIECRWRRIRAEWNEEIPKQYEVSALHVLVDKSQELECQRRLHQIYGSTAKVYPLQVAFRFIPSYVFLPDRRGQKKFKDARMRQSNFTTSMIVTKSWDIEPYALYDTTSTGFTLRELIMSIRSLKHPTDPLFHTVDQPTNGIQVVLFLHHPDDNEYAMQVKAGLLPYLRWKWRTKLKMTYPPLSEAETEFLTPLLYKFFTAGAVTTADGMDWDDVAHEVTSAVSDNLTAILDGDDKYKFKVVNLEMQAVLLAEASASKKSAVAAKAPRQHRKDTTDSISTIRGPRTSLKTITQTTPPAHNNNESDVSSQSSRTEISAATGKSDLSGQSTKSGNSTRTSKSTQALNENIQILLGNMQLLLQHKQTSEDQIKTLTNRLQAIEPLSASSGTDHHPPPNSKSAPHSVRDGEQS